MLEILKTDIFVRWLKRLRDDVAVARIAKRLDRLEQGNFGDVRPVGEGVSELRIDYGPGYRVYFIRDGLVLIVLLCGGDKRTQERDIATAKALARKWKE